MGPVIYGKKFTLLVDCCTVRPPLVHNPTKNISLAGGFRLPADPRLSFTADGPQGHLKIPLMSEDPISLYPSTWRLGELRNVFTAKHGEFSWKQFMLWNLMGLNKTKVTTGGWGGGSCPSLFLELMHKAGEIWRHFLSLCLSQEQGCKMNGGQDDSPIPQEGTPSTWAGQRREEIISKVHSC